MPDGKGRYAPYRKALEGFRAAGRLRGLADVTGRDGKWLELDGKKYLNLSSNDYLGVGTNEALHREFYSMLGREGKMGDYFAGGVSSRLLAGNGPQYRELENRLAAFYGREAAMVFNSGYHANTGMVPALAGKGDLVLSDKLNHASIVDGAMLSRAEVRRYKHLDLSYLESILAAEREKYRTALIVSEAVFSMDGDAADIKKLVELKKKYGAILYIDEAHSAGLCGRQGRGLADDAGVAPDVDILMGTFGKAYGAYGAFAAMDGVLKEFLVNTMRPFIFTTALPPVAVSWALFVLEKMPAMDGRRSVLRETSASFRGALGMGGAGAALGPGHIIPYVIGKNEDAAAASAALREQGFLVFPVRPPTVPEGTARLRFSMTSCLEAADLGKVPEILHDFPRLLEAGCRRPGIARRCTDGSTGSPRRLDEVMAITPGESKTGVGEGE